MKVFHLDAPSYKSKSPTSLFELHERRKRLEYEERIVNVERGSFTPLVFTITGAAGPMAERFLQRLAGKLTEKDSSTVLCYNGVASLSAFFCSAAWCNPLRSRKSVPPPASRPLRTRVGRCGEQNGGSLTHLMRRAGRSFLGFLSLASPFLIQTCTYMYFWTLT